MIGKRLKELRIKRGYSQQDLGSLVGVTKVSICGYENGTRVPNIEKLFKLADVLDTTTDYLLGREIIVDNPENSHHVGYISHDDVNFIMELRHFSNLYSKIIKDTKRAANIINNKFSK